MNAISAVFEKGVFRPVDPVDLPEGTRVVIETESVATERIRAARKPYRLEVIRMRDELGMSGDLYEPDRKELI